MRIYLDTFWDLYWDLHLGVRGQDIPQQVRQIGENFNTVLAYRDPTQKIVYDNYMAVRKNLDFLKSWIDDRLKDIQSGKTPEPEKTFAWYWLKNGEESEYFNHKDVVFECFHNFVAFSQWGNTLYNIMAKLGRDTGDAQAKDWFTKTMAADYDNPGGSAFPPLERFVMELFRTISPNAGSISAMTETRPPAFERHGFIVSPHTSTSHDPVQWPNPDDFDPSRYEHAPTSQDIDEARIRQMGLAKCPFDQTSFDVKDGRKAALRNSGFGTVFAIADDRPLPVCDYAGFAPFGFGYRRCPGEQFTIMAFEDLIRKVSKDRLHSSKSPTRTPRRCRSAPAPRRWCRSVPPPSSTTTSDLSARPRTPLDSPSTGAGREADVRSQRRRHRPSTGLCAGGHLRLLADEIDELTAEITIRVTTIAPSLLAIVGGGALTAAKIVGETAHAGRFRSKDAFARHNGAAPLPV